MGYDLENLLWELRFGKLTKGTNLCTSAFLLRLVSLLFHRFVITLRRFSRATSIPIGGDRTTIPFVDPFSSR